MIEKLNLPSFDCKITKIDGKDYIFDVIRLKNIFLTPEEWVRQHFIHLLMSEYNVPKSLIKIEGGLTYNSLKKRSDILIFNREGSPFLLVECKRPTVKIDKNVMNQVSIYNKKLHARYVAVTNGFKTFCFESIGDSNELVQISNLPHFI